MSKLLVSSVLILVIGTSAGLRPAEGQVVDGNLWRSLSADARTWYLKGYTEAMGSCASFASPPLNGRPESANSECRVLVGFKDNKVIALILRVTPSQLRDAVDQFYIDPTNRLIPVPRALGVVFERLTGSSEEDLRKMIEFERWFATARSPAQ